MKFPAPLTQGVLVQRYKRFFADVKLDGGKVVTAHCANSGSMMGVKEPGSRVWLSPSPNPKSKLAWRWEMIEVDGAKVGINTMHPNRIVEEALREKRVPELKAYLSFRREVKYGTNSRIDLLLEGPGLCYVEVKNVTLKRNGLAQFPDAVTTRGTKHLNELRREAKEGNRAVMLYLVQRADCEAFSIAADIDPEYAETFEKAMKSGVEALCYQCALDHAGIRLERPLPLKI
jgi:sugar fermentation stimulation protein A